VRLRPLEEFASSSALISHIINLRADHADVGIAIRCWQGTPRPNPFAESRKGSALPGGLSISWDAMGSRTSLDEQKPVLGVLIPERALGRPA